MKFFRVHTSDIAWITQKPRGIFTTVGKLVEAKTMTEEEIAEYWKQREYFEKLPGLRIPLKFRTSGTSLLFIVKCVLSMA